MLRCRDLFLRRLRNVTALLVLQLRAQIERHCPQQDPYGLPPHPGILGGLAHVRDERGPQILPAAGTQRKQQLRRRHLRPRLPPGGKRVRVQREELREGAAEDLGPGVCRGALGDDLLPLGQRAVVDRLEPQLDELAGARHGVQCSPRVDHRVRDRGLPSSARRTAPDAFDTRRPPSHLAAHHDAAPLAPAVAAPVRAALDLLARHAPRADHPARPRAAHGDRRGGRQDRRGAGGADARAAGQNGDGNVHHRTRLRDPPRRGCVPRSSGGGLDRARGSLHRRRRGAGRGDGLHRGAGQENKIDRRAAGFAARGGAAYAEAVTGPCLLSNRLALLDSSSGPLGPAWRSTEPQGRPRSAATKSGQERASMVRGAGADSRVLGPHRCSEIALKPDYGERQACSSPARLGTDDFPNVSRFRMLNLASLSVLCARRECREGHGWRGRQVDRSGHRRCGAPARIQGFSGRIGAQGVP